MWFLLSVALAAPPTVGGIVRPEAALDLARDYDDENWLELHTWARAWARGEFENGDAWFLEGRFQHHYLHADDDNNGLTTESEGWWGIDLGETGWDGKVVGPVRLRIGALTERWGKLDLLPVSDVLNPRDGRSGLVTPLDWQRVPIPMAVVAVEGGPIRSETVLIPLATADRLWLRETDWSYVRQGQARDLLLDMQDWPNGSQETQALFGPAIESVDEMSPSMRRGLDAAVNGNSLPEAFVVNGEIGQRFELSARNLDLGVEVGYLRSRQPESNLDPVLVDLLRAEVLPDSGEFTTVQGALAGGPLDVNWPRTVVTGADVSVLAGPLQIRAEGMYQSNKVVRLHYGRSTGLPSLGAGLGLDYVRGSSFVATVESRWMRLFEPPDDLMFSLEDQIQLAAGVRWTVANERLTMQLGGAWDFSYEEYLLRPSVGWRFSDNVLAEVGAVLLGGSTPAAESLQEAFTYTGGPLSYWSQNDAVTVSVSFIK